MLEKMGQVWLGVGHRDRNTLDRRRGLGPASGDANDGDPLDASYLSLGSMPCGAQEMATSGPLLALDRRTTDRLPLPGFPAPEQDPSEMLCAGGHRTGSTQWR